MPTNISLTTDQIVSIPLIFSDGTGPLPAPSTGGSIAIDHPEIATAYLSPDDMTVTITPVSIGSCIITYTNTDGVSDTLNVTITESIPTEVEFEVTDATFSPKLNVWNISFSTEFDYSNGNKTATTNVINHTSTALSTFSRVDEKVYFEMLSGPNNAGLYYGIGTAGLTNQTLLGVEAHGLALRNDGHWFASNGDTDSGIGPVNNLHLGFAVDLAAGKIYVRDMATPTAWFGAGAGADPVAGTGGFAFAPFAAPTFLAFCSNQNGLPESCTGYRPVHQFLPQG